MTDDVVTAPTKRHVVIFGGSGFLGSELRSRLVNRGDRVTVVARDPSRDFHGWTQAYWDAETLGPWVDVLEDVDVVVHMAGKRVDCRPNKRNIAELIRSREGTVALVGRALARLSHRPDAWIQMSSLARFGDFGDAIIDESTTPPEAGHRQMVEVCRRWEAAFEEASRGISRTVLLRPSIGIGGIGDPATGQLSTLARFGMAGKIGSGRQWVSWIGADDLFALIERAAVDERMSGTYHLTSPNPVQNRELMAAYRAAAGRKLGLPAPRPIAKIGAKILGSDPALALTSRRGIPTRLLAEGFPFTCTSIDEAAATATAPTIEAANAPPPLPRGMARRGMRRVSEPRTRS